MKLAGGAIATGALVVVVAGAGYYYVQKMAKEQGIRPANFNVSEEVKNKVFHTPPSNIPTQQEIPGVSRPINPAWAGDGGAPVKGGGNPGLPPPQPGDESAVGPPVVKTIKPKPQSKPSPSQVFSYLKERYQPPVRSKPSLRRPTTRRTVKRKPISAALSRLF